MKTKIKKISRKISKIIFYNLMAEIEYKKGQGARYRFLRLLEDNK
jgi:hypothetical protein